MLSYHCAGGDYTTTTTTTFHCPLVLQYNVPPHMLEAQEQTFIQHFQPKLNFPYISPHMKKALRGISQPSHKITARGGLRSIWAKLRRRHLPRNIAPLHRSSTFQRQSQVWRTLCDLASNTKRRFDNSRELLRRRIPLATICTTQALPQPTTTTSLASRQGNCHSHAKTQVAPWCSPDTQGYRTNYTTGTEHIARGNQITHPHAPANNPSGDIPYMYTTTMS